MDSIFEQPRSTPKQTPIHQNFRAPVVPDASLILQNQPKTKTIPIPPHQQSYNAWKLRNAPNLQAQDSFVTTQKKADKENRFENYVDYQYYNLKKDGSNTSILKKQVRFDHGPPQPTTTVVVKSPNFSALLKNQNNTNDENVKSNYKTKDKTRDGNGKKSVRVDDEMNVNSDVNKTPVVFKRYIAPLRNSNKSEVELHSPEVLKSEQYRMESSKSGRCASDSIPGFSNPLMSLKPIVPQHIENTQAPFDNCAVRNKQLDLSLHDGMHRNDQIDENERFRMQNIRQSLNAINTRNENAIKSRGIQNVHSCPTQNEPHNLIRHNFNQNKILEGNDSFMNYKPQQMIFNQIAGGNKIKEMEERPLSQRIQHECKNIQNDFNNQDSHDQNGLYNQNNPHDQKNSQNASQNGQNNPQIFQNRNVDIQNYNLQNDNRNLQNDPQNDSQNHNTQKDYQNHNLQSSQNSNPQNESQNRNDPKNVADSNGCGCNCKNNQSDKVNPSVTELLSIVKMQNEQLHILQNQVEMLIKMNETKNRKESLEYLLKTDEMMKHKEDADSDLCVDVKNKQRGAIKSCGSPRESNMKRMINRNDRKIINHMECKRKNKRVPTKDVAVYTDEQVRSTEEVCRRITKEHYSTKQMKSDKISVGIMTSFQVSLSSPYQQYDSTESTSSTDSYQNHQNTTRIPHNYKNRTNKPIQVFTDTWHDKNIPNEIDNDGVTINKNRLIGSDVDESILDETDKDFEEIGLNGSVEVEEPPLSPNNTVHVHMQDYESDSDDESSSADPGWTFYDNILGKVNNILENSPVPNEQKKTTDCTFQQIKQQAIQNLREIGNEEFRNVNPSDVSFHVKQLLMKYMSDEELTNLARRNGRHHKKVSTINPNKILDITTLKKQPKLL